MIIGSLRVELHLQDSHSLKDRRSALNSLKERLRGKFNVAVAEVEPNDTWQRACLGIVSVGSEPGHVRRMLEEVSRWVRADRSVAVIRIEQE